MARLIGARVIPDAKLAKYLLDPNHPVGGAKARYFVSFGFLREQADAFALALHRHADQHPIHAERETVRGTSRQLRCEVTTPDGRNPAPP